MWTEDVFSSFDEMLDADGDVCVINSFLKLMDCLLGDQEQRSNFGGSINYRAKNRRQNNCHPFVRVRFLQSAKNEMSTSRFLLPYRTRYCAVVDLLIQK